MKKPLPNKGFCGSPNGIRIRIESCHPVMRHRVKYRQIMVFQISYTVACLPVVARFAAHGHQMATACIAWTRTMSLA